MTSSSAGSRLRADVAGALPWLAAGLFMAACGFQSPGAPVAGPAGNVDGGPLDGNGSSNKPDGAMACAWATHFDSCMLPGEPPNPLTLTQPTVWIFDTHGTGVFRGTVPPAMTYVLKVVPQYNGGPDVLVLYSSAFTLEAGATLAVTGDKPLVIASGSTIQLDGVLDAGSHNIGTGSIVGPGANLGTCTTGLDGSNNGDGGGGGGGALAASGGTGGDGKNGGTAGKAGALVAVPGFLRAGCPGGKGGKGGGGSGGNGGGAIELVARGSIVVNGKINAGGAGGGRGQQQTGGGGGGSGGVISLDSTSVMLMSTAILAANGGGGGGGENDGNASAGTDGLVGALGAAGGNSDVGAVGGLGGALNPLAGGPGMGSSGDGGGGGGGGGSAGYVIVYAGSFTPSSAVVSPPATRP